MISGNHLFHKALLGLMIIVFIRLRFYKKKQKKNQPKIEQKTSNNVSVFFWFVLQTAAEDVASGVNNNIV